MSHLQYLFLWSCVDYDLNTVYDRWVKFFFFFKKKKRTAFVDHVETTCGVELHSNFVSYAVYKGASVEIASSSGHDGDGDPSTVFEIYEQRVTGHDGDGDLPEKGYTAMMATVIPRDSTTQDIRP